MLNRKLSDIDGKNIALLVKQDPRFLVARIGLLSESRWAPKVSRTTMFRTLKRLGFKIFSPQRIPMLTKKHKEARVSWCTANKNTDWSKVCFTDESYGKISAMQAVA